MLPIRCEKVKRARFDPAVPGQVAAPPLRMSSVLCSRLWLSKETRIRLPCSCAPAQTAWRYAFGKMASNDKAKNLASSTFEVANDKKGELTSTDPSLYVEHEWGSVGVGGSEATKALGEKPMNLRNSAIICD